MGTRGSNKPGKAMKLAESSDEEMMNVEGEEVIRNEDDGPEWKGFCAEGAHDGNAEWFLGE